MQLRHLKIIYALFSFAIVVLATSCEPKQQEEVIDAPVKVARVFDSYLYMDDLQGVVQKNTPTNDSIDIVHSYINNWINKKLILNEAANDKNIDFAEIDSKVAEYRNSLIIYYYQTNIINSKVDTNITVSEIETYYNDNKDDFKLNEDYAKVNIITINNKHHLLSKIKKYVYSSKEDDRFVLNELCVKNDINIAIHNDTWTNVLKIKEFVNSIETNPKKTTTILPKKNSYTITDNTNTYFIIIDEYKQAGEQSPIELVKDKIATIIIKKRRADFVSGLYRTLNDNAAKQNDYEIYIKK